MTVLEKMELIEKLIKSDKDIEVLMKGVTMNIWKKNRKYAVNQTILSSGTVLLFKLDKTSLEQFLSTAFMNMENSFEIKWTESRNVIKQD